MEECTHPNARHLLSPWGNSDTLTPACACGFGTIGMEYLLNSCCGSLGTWLSQQQLILSLRSYINTWPPAMMNDRVTILVYPLYVMSYILAYAHE